MNLGKLQFAHMGNNLFGMAILESIVFARYCSMHSAGINSHSSLKGQDHYDPHFTEEETEELRG